MPGHLTSFKVGGHFGAKGSSLNDRGAGARERRFNYASERSRSGTWSHHSLAQVGSSVSEPRRLFFRGARLRFIWTESGLNLVPVTMRPNSDGFLRFCHEALWSLLRATKRHKAACGFCFAMPLAH